MSAHPAQFAGTRRFQVRHRLGAGGMGVVYEAMDRERGTLVALKTLSHLEPDAIYRFKREFRALRDLVHPNLVRLGELFEHDGAWFFTMERLRGQDFLSYVRRQEEVRVDAPTAPLLYGPALASPAGRGDRAAGGFDEGRVRWSLSQLTAGLRALHAARKIHSDIKPSNVMVLDDGRLVLLDFGLVADRDPSRLAAPMPVGGTPAYMAPEQAAGRPVTPAADWYAVGVLLYEAVTGRLPYEGKAAQVLLDKQQHLPDSPRATNPTVSTWLDELCVDLLQIDPSARPSGAAVARRLGARASGRAADVEERARAAGEPLFVGREDELAELRDEREQVAGGAMRAIAIVGPSGIGKTALAREVVREAIDAGAFALTGGCSAFEAVRFKALDGVVDGLVDYLCGLSEASVTELLPDNAALLVRLFPVMGRVGAIARVAEAGVEILDTLEQRARAFAALRELLRGIARRSPLVIAIDDMQWADHDSLVLLSEIVREPEPPRLLLLMTCRHVGDGVGALDWIDRLPISVRRLELAPLSVLHAGQLSALLLERAGASQVHLANTVAVESRGHPLYIQELARHIGSRGAELEQVPALDEAIWRRAAGYGPTAQRVLEVLAVCGAPERLGVVRAAVELKADELERIVAELRAADLVRSSGLREVDRIGVYHDRVRESVLANTAADRQRAHHRRLAELLSAQPALDAQALLDHWIGAGERARAGECAVLAAEQAAHQLAFARAARDYELALELLAPQGDRRRELLTSLADARANAGALSAAAQAYLEAADGAPRDQELDLRRRAVEQYLRAGRLGEGGDLCDQLLRAVGMTMPASERAAILSIIGSRVALGARGRRFRPRSRAEVDGERLRRLEVCWSVVSSINIVNPLFASAVQFRYVREALASGDVYHAALAVTTEAGFAALAGERARQRVLTRSGDALALVEASGSEHARGVYGVVRAAAHFLQGEWASCAQLATDAYGRLVTHCADRRYEADQAAVWQLAGLTYSGEIKRVVELALSLLREAEARADEYLLSALRTWRSSIVWLALDQPDEGFRQLQASARPRRPGEAYNIYHCYQLQTAAQVLLYQGEATEAHRLVEREWPHLRRSVAARIQLTRADVQFLRARCALAAAARGGEQARAAIAIAEEAARRLERERADWIVALAAAVRAGLAARGGRLDQARAHLERARDGFEATGMRLLEAVTECRLGALEGGDAGRARAAAAKAWMSAQSIRSPESFVDLYAPGVAAARSE